MIMSNDQSELTLGTTFAKSADPDQSMYPSLVLAKLGACAVKSLYCLRENDTHSGEATLTKLFCSPSLKSSTMK